MAAPVRTAATVHTPQRRAAAERVLLHAMHQVIKAALLGNTALSKRARHVAPARA